MAYDNVPAENAPALPPRADEYTFIIDIEGTHPDGNPRATVDDLDMFDTETKVGNKRMLDFLDRIVTRVELRGQVLVSRVVVGTTTVTDGDGARAEDVIEERVEGVRGKKVPYPALKRIFAAVGQAMKDANGPN